MEYLKNLKFTSEYWVIALPCILMVIDIITGYYNAWRKKEISSSKMRDGLGKKMAEISFIFISYLFNFAFALKEITVAVSFYVIFMEMVSIIENLEKLNFPLPTKIKEVFNNDKGEE